MEIKNQKQICIICNKDFEGYGNNPSPIKRYEDGRACDDCNINRVLAARLKDAYDKGGNN